MANGDDGDDVYICYGCIGDSFLKEEVRREGHKRQCHFCEKARKAWPLDKLAERVQGVIDEHFRITPSDPRDEYLFYDEDMDWERRGDPVAAVIAEIAELEPKPAEEVREHLSRKIYFEAFEGGYENPFGSDTYYEEGRSDTYGFCESWEFFRQEIKTRSRFFGSFRPACARRYFWLRSTETREGTPAIKEILPADDMRFLYRARIAFESSELREMLSDPVRMGCPPRAWPEPGA